MVYNARWFELLLLFGLVNIIGVTIKSKLYKKTKLTIFVFHLAFAIIIIGAGITRYISKEGSMHIREGEVQNIWYTSQAQIGIELRTNETSKVYSYPVLFSGNSRNKFTRKFSYEGHKIKVKIEKYISKAEQSLQFDKQGLPYLHLVISGNMGRENIFLTTGGQMKIGSAILQFNPTDTSQKSNVIIVKTEESGSLIFNAPFDILRTAMADQSTDTLKAKSWHAFSPMTLYNINGIPLVMSQYLPMGVLSAREVDTKDADLPSALYVNIDCDGSSKKIVVWGKKDNVGDPSTVELNGVKIFVNYGAGIHKLPFSLKLNDFILKRYPGSESPSWFESSVLLIDKDKNKTEEHRIFMNNILKHRGYRFYQSSYDLDEKGTILSLNRDGLGTFVTYLGYLLMALGMILSLLNKNSRFRYLTTPSVRATKILLPLVLGLFIFSNRVCGQDNLSDKVQKLPVIEKQHAEEFGKLLVQDNGGRIEPINTLASEVLRKVSSNIRHSRPTRYF
jgi:hypothetical protein